MHPTATTGMFAGLLLGLAWATAGFNGFVLTAVLGALGFTVGKVISGQLDLTAYLGGRNR